MQLSSVSATRLAQLQALKSYVIANYASVFDGVTAAAMNATASPDYWAWRTSVMELEFTRGLSVDGTSYSWPAYIARSQGERDAWARLFMGGGTGSNPSLTNVRQGFADIFSGSANSAPAQRQHLLAIARRKALIGEKVLAVVATGPGNDGGQARGSAANPDNFGDGAEGNITLQNLIDADGVSL